MWTGLTGSSPTIQRYVPYRTSTEERTPRRLLPRVGQGRLHQRLQSRTSPTADGNPPALELRCSPGNTLSCEHPTLMPLDTSTDAVWPGPVPVTESDKSVLTSPPNSTLGAPVSGPTTSASPLRSPETWGTLWRGAEPLATHL